MFKKLKKNVNSVINFRRLTHFWLCLLETQVYIIPRWVCLVVTDPPRGFSTAKVKSMLMQPTTLHWRKLIKVYDWYFSHQDLPSLKYSIYFILHYCNFTTNHVKQPIETTYRFYMAYLRIMYYTYLRITYYTYLRIVL